MSYTTFTRGRISLTMLRATTHVGRGATYLFIQGFAFSVISLIHFVVLTRTLLKEEIGIHAILSFTLNLVPILGTFALRSAAVKSYDIEGDIAIIRVHRILKPKAHVIAETIMKTHKQVNTVPLQISPVWVNFGYANCSGLLAKTRLKPFIRSSVAFNLEHRQKLSYISCDLLESNKSFIILSS